MTGSRDDEHLAAISDAADRDYERNPGRPLTADLAPPLRRLLPPVRPERQDAA